MSGQIERPRLAIVSRCFPQSSGKVVRNRLSSDIVRGNLPSNGSSLNELFTSTAASTSAALLRPPFALKHLQQRDAEHLVYHSPKPRLDGTSDLVLPPLCQR